MAPRLLYLNFMTHPNRGNAKNDVRRNRFSKVHGLVYLLRCFPLNAPQGTQANLFAPVSTFEYADHVIPLSPDKVS